MKPRWIWMPWWKAWALRTRDPFSNRQSPTSWGQQGFQLIWPSTDWLKDVPAICICIDTVRLTWLECRGPVKGCAAIWEYPPAVEGIHLLANSVFLPHFLYLVNILLLYLLWLKFKNQCWNNEMVQQRFLLMVFFCLATGRWLVSFQTTAGNLIVRVKIEFGNHEHFYKHK